MAGFRVGVLRGGKGHEYEVSLKTGGSVLVNLPEKYVGRDLLVTKDGTWHLGGLPIHPRQIAGQVDVIFNALHGEYGEDGKVQNLLDSLNIPYTGSGTFASAVGMNKELAKRVFRQAGLRVPHGVTLRLSAATGGSEPAAIRDYARFIFNKISPPWVVKPADRGSSVGLSLARNFAALEAAITLAALYSEAILVEEYVKGREATLGVIDHFRDLEHYALPSIEIRRPDGKAVWGYDDKYNGETEEVCPGAFSEEEKKLMAEMAVKAHRSLGLRHYSRADFIISARRGAGGRPLIYLLETNTLPGLTNESLLPKSLAAVGCSYSDFLDHLINLALQKP